MLAIAAALLTFSSCKDEEDNPTTPTAPSGLKKVYVLNEGNFGSNNADISIYYPEGDSVVNMAYSSVNNGLMLGDIAQSMTAHGGEYLVAMNNNGRVERMSQNDLGATGAIDGLPSPRFILPISSSKAYVSSLFGDLTIVDLTSNTITGSIASGVTTGQMSMIGGMAYVCYEGADAVHVFDPVTDEEVAVHTSSRTPVKVLADSQGRPWMLFSGTYYDPVTFELMQEQPHLLRVDPQSGEVDLDIAFDEMSGIRDMVYWSETDEIYVLQGQEIIRVDVAAGTYAADPSFSLLGNYYGRMSIDPDNGEIYLCDANGFVTDGVVERYANDGSLLSSFGVGPIPNGVVFD